MDDPIERSLNARIEKFHVIEDESSGALLSYFDVVTDDPIRMCERHRKRVASYAYMFTCDDGVVTNLCDIGFFEKFDTSE